MNTADYAYFVERPRRMDDLLVPHPAEKERRYPIVAACSCAEKRQKPE